MSHKASSPTGAPINGGDFKRTPMRPMIAEYDPKRQGVKTELSDMVLTKYKCERNDVPVTVTGGSTLPLVEKHMDEEAALYNPFEHRKLAKPTSDLDTLIHLLKGSLGSGILAMPFAFKSSGLWFGLVATFFIGAVCTYCVHILVKCAHELCRRTQTPSLGFADVAETAFLAGPEGVKKYARLAKAIINTFLVLDLLGCCCVYMVFVGGNLKKVIDPNLASELDIRYYMAALIPFLLILSLVRNLKYLAPFSMLANFLIFIALVTTFVIIFNKPTWETEHVPSFAGISTLPVFFGTAIFALEGIGVVMPLENNMKSPTHFIGCPSVLNIGMFCVVTLYSIVGFFGYAAYGDKVEDSISLNLGTDKPAQAVQIMIAIAIFFTYGLQFYVPMEIIWKNIKHRFGARKLTAEYIVRILLVLAIAAVAIAFPKLGPIINLIGAVCLSTLGLMFPSVIELVTVWEKENGLGRFNWVLWKNILIILFGFVGFVTGCYVSIKEMKMKYST